MEHMNWFGPIFLITRTAKTPFEKDGNRLENGNAMPVSTWRQKKGLLIWPNHSIGLDHRFGQSASKMLRFRLDSRFRGNDKQLQSQRFFRHSRESGNPE
ncbi:MAG: hypothetical protein HQL77_11705 [Magnetococcales bacterium]|nr:hypothetical protein [Magnetococcales bacterium]